MLTIIQNITDTPSYKLADIVFSKKEPFTLDDIVSELSKVGVHKDRQIIKRALDLLRDIGIIIEQESYYFLYIRDF